MMATYKLNTTARSALTEIIETAYRNVPPDLYSLYLGENIIGHVNPTIYTSISNFLNQEDQSLHLIQATAQKVIFTPAPPYELSTELRILAQHLRDENVIQGWRDEEFSFLDENAHERFRVERTFFRALGIHSRAIHVNGYTNDQKLWIARRSSSKFIDPDLLDNITAGGVSANETLMNCAMRELYEEAGISSEQALKLNPIGAITVRRGITHSSLHHETLYTYDLLLPNDFIPKNQDDEVSSFLLINFEEAFYQILNEKMTIDASVVTADFLLRHC
jgi:8-oxo-dGTP pyrophosphatase MutT (NUDIX family)